MRVDVSELALDYLYCLKEEYVLARHRKASRLEVQWGKFSANMNRVTKKLIEDKHPAAFMLKMHFNIWVAYSELLELYHKYSGTYRKKKEKRKLKKAIKILEKVMITGNVPENLEKYWED